MQSKRAASVQPAYNIDEGGGVTLAHASVFVVLPQLATSSLIAQREGEREGGSRCAIISARANKIRPDRTFQPDGRRRKAWG